MQAVCCPSLLIGDLVDGGSSHAGSCNCSLYEAQISCTVGRTRSARKRNLHSQLQFRGAIGPTEFVPNGEGCGVNGVWGAGQRSIARVDGVARVVDAEDLVPLLLSTRRVLVHRTPSRGTHLRGVRGRLPDATAFTQEPGQPGVQAVVDL